MHQLHRGRHQRDADSGPHQSDRRLQFVGPLRHMDPHATGFEECNHVVGVAWSWIAGVQHEGFFGQVAQADGTGEQRVAGGQGGDQAIFGEDGLDDRRIVDAYSTEADVDTPGLQCLHLLQGGHLGQPELQLQGFTAAQAADQFRQHAIERRRRKTDAQPGLFPQADPPRVVADLVQLFQQRGGVFLEKPPGVGQLQRSPAFQQHHAEFVFQLLDLPAQGRLGDV